MKHFKQIFMMLVMTAGLFGLTGCVKKEAVTVKEFNQVMEDAGAEIVDATDQLSDRVVKEISLAVFDDYQIEFYVLTNEDTASAVFFENRAIFEENKGSVSSEISKSIGNYNYYALTSGGSCYLLARVDNTMLYVVADAGDKDEITEMFKTLGY